MAAGLLAIEAYTSGIAWMVNHLGPGSFLAALWFLAALHNRWLGAAPDPGLPPLTAWIRTGAATAVLVLAFRGLGLIPEPATTLPPDAVRYARAIEAEFRGAPADRVLLDYGTWPYLASRVVTRDHAGPFGEAGYTQTADFSGLMGRIETGYYARVLIRDFDGPDLAYDHASWPVSSGIREALARHYREVRRIPAVAGNRIPPWFKAVSVLEPVADSVAALGGPASKGEQSP